MSIFYISKCKDKMMLIMRIGGRRTFLPCLQAEFVDFFLCNLLADSRGIKDSYITICGCHGQHIIIQCMETGELS